MVWHLSAAAAAAAPVGCRWAGGRCSCAPVHAARIAGPSTCGWSSSAPSSPLACASLLASRSLGVLQREGATLRCRERRNRASDHATRFHDCAGHGASALMMSPTPSAQVGFPTAEERKRRERRAGRPWRGVHAALPCLVCARSCGSQDPDALAGARACVGNAFCDAQLPCAQAQHKRTRVLHRCSLVLAGMPGACGGHQRLSVIAG